MSSSVDISYLCRSCMKELSVWEKENFELRTLEIFSLCTNIKISDDDHLPRIICYECTVKIESSFAYINEAQKVDITLRNILSRNETSVIIEPDHHKNFIEEHVLNSDLFQTDNNENNAIPHSDPDILPDVANEVDQFERNNEICSFKPSEESLQTQLLESTNPKIGKVSATENKREEKKKNTCSICSKGFTSNIWFSKHMEKEHTGKKYTCNLCQKTFSKPSQLNYHSISHSDERKFACGTCGKRFKRQKQLSVHIRAHSDIKPYACEKCTMRFKRRSILKCHMKVHEEDKQFLCSFCGWSFAQAGNLSVHVRRHTGERPYSCACGFRCAAASNLRRHQRAHARRRPHACTHCGKGFCDASSLARHSRTHTGELPYQCPQCPRAFADSWKRKLHLMRAHRLALQQIPRMRRDGATLPHAPG